MSRVKGSKNKTTLIREIAKQKKEEWKGLSQGYQMELWLKEFGKFDKTVAEEMGWNTYRVRVADLRHKGYKINCNKGTGEYKLISLPSEDYIIKPSFKKERGKNKKIDVVLYADEEEKVIEAPESMRRVKTSFKEAILDHLKTHGSINAFVANDLYGCRCLNNVIYILRKDGYNIIKTKSRTIRQHNTKVDRALSVYEFNLISTPNDVLEETKKDSKYILISVIDNDAIRIGVFNNSKDAEEELIKVKAQYVDFLNEKANKNCKFVESKTTDNILKITKGLFGVKEEVYTKFSIIEV